MDSTRMAAVLQRLARALYDGAPIPAREGGHLFREVCEERREAGDLYWTERRLHELARRLGLWPWTVEQVGRACAAARMTDVPSPLAERLGLPSGSSLPTAPENPAASAAD